MFRKFSLRRQSEKAAEDAGSIGKARSLNQLSWRRNANSGTDDGSSLAHAVDYEVESQETVTTLVGPSATVIMFSDSQQREAILNSNQELLKIQHAPNESCASAAILVHPLPVEEQEDENPFVADFEPITAARAPQLDTLDFPSAAEEASAFVMEIIAKKRYSETAELTQETPRETPATDAALRDAFRHKQFNRKQSEKSDSWGDIASALKTLDSVAASLPPVDPKKAAPKKPSSASLQANANGVLSKPNAAKKESSGDYPFSHGIQQLQLQQRQLLQQDQYQQRQLQQYPSLMYQQQRLQQQQQQYQQQRISTTLYTSSYAMQNMPPLQQQYAEATVKDSEDLQPLHTIAASLPSATATPVKLNSSSQLFADDPELAASLAGAIQSLDLLSKSPSELQKAQEWKKETGIAGVVN
ncbi:hypothetical protein BDR26DRAFT_946835 [Obelidium mucronatum]|nr:hypothetical protein BDR26DRAFT_946835 [Obelidium mucronatum]